MPWDVASLTIDPWAWLSPLTRLKKEPNRCGAVMAQSMQSQAAPEDSLHSLRSETARTEEPAACVQSPEPDHLSNVMTTLEQEAFSGGAEFVGK